VIQQSENNGGKHFSIKNSNKFLPNDSEIILDDNVVKKVDKFRYQDSIIITEDSGTDKDIPV
jgi:hypothetical protein